MRPALFLISARSDELIQERIVQLLKDLAFSLGFCKP